MHKYFRTLMSTAAVATLGTLVMLTNAHYAHAQDAAQKDAGQKKATKAVKDTGEFDIYNEVIKDSSPPSPNLKKLVTDLDTWTQKYPNTDFKVERTYYYLQGYSGTGQTSKALEMAKTLLADGLDGLRAGLDNPGMVLQALYFASAAVTTAAASGTPSQDELDTGSKAAHMLLDYGKDFFAPAKKPATLKDADWELGLKQTQDTGTAALLQIDLYPGNTIYKTNPHDPATCAKAEPAYQKALQDYPNSGTVALQLAQVDLCQQSATPQKAQDALYEFARAAALPPGGPLGLTPDNQKAIDGYLTKSYVGFHGSDEGLAQLKDLALKAPTPPADFKIKSKTEIAREKEEEFRSKNPQLATWMGLKAQLADTNGQQYFDGQLKDADVKGENGARALKGIVVGGLDARGKPRSCRPDQLLVAVPLPDQSGPPVPEITLKLDKALTDKPETGIEIQFDGIPTAFTKEPFMLTMDSTKEKIDGLKGTPCTNAAPAKKGAPGKKK